MYQCGNSIVEPGEDCDSGDLNGATCVSLGFTSGSLSCSGTCTYNTSGCITISCGDSQCNGAETSCSCPGDCGDTCGDAIGLTIGATLSGSTTSATDDYGPTGSGCPSGGMASGSDVAYSLSPSSTWACGAGVTRERSASSSFCSGKSVR